MTPIFGTDITNDNNNEQIDGGIFVSKIAPEELSEKLKFAENELDDILSDGNVSGNMKLLIISPAVLMVLLFIVRIICNAYNFRGFPVFPVIGIVLTVSFAIIYTIILIRTKKTLTNSETKRSTEHIEEVTQEIYDALGVPAGIPDTDILCLEYKLKYGKIVPESYWNSGMKLFCEGDALCIVCGDKKYSIPMSEIVGIGTVKKKISVFGWNKDEPCNKGEYKKYKLREDKYGFIKMKQYHILEITHGGEEYGLYFPSYELPVIEKLTGAEAK